MKRSEFIKSGLALASIPSLYSFGAENTEKMILEKFHLNDDWELLRKQFLINKDLIYLNNGTMGINPKPVIEELNTQYIKLAESGNYPGANEMNILKSKLGAVLGINERTLAITKNVTEGINIACWGQNLKKGDEVLITKHEHVGGCAAWIYRAQKEGIVLKTFDLKMTAEETFESLKKAVTNKTRVIAVPHIPCTIGQILPIKEICAFAKSKNIISVIDGAHPLGMISVNITDLDCDYYSGCLHKWLLGPIGTGFIYINPRVLNQTNIFNLGAYSMGKFDMTTDPPMIDALIDETQRFSCGTYNGPGYLAAVKAIEWYEGIGIDKIEKRVKQLSLYTQEKLKEFKSEIEILSPIEERSRGAQTTFKFTKKKSEEFVGFARQEFKITSRHVHEGRLDGVRISTHYYNNEKQIDVLVLAIEKFLKK